MRQGELEGLVNELSQRVAELENSGALQRSLQSSGIDTGDTAWLLASTALVLFMTIPGLGLFFSGMVRSKNVLSTMMQVMSIVCLITFLWLCFGYSLAFAPAQPGGSQSGTPVIGNASRFWLVGLGLNSVHQIAPAIPEAVFCTYQMTFAIITPCLIVGSFADRMKFNQMLLFMALWHLLVYCPIAHSMWHPDGFLNKAGILDYAGGNVVHIASGISGLVSTIVLGNRKGFGEESFDPHNVLLTCVGACMLWVGWFGFNAGSAYGATQAAGMAMLNTQIATGVAAFSWMLSEWSVRGQPSVLGLSNGAIAGMVAITPCAGYIDTTGAFFVGLLAGPACYFGSHLKDIFNYDDALDSFGIHAIGGITGGILCGFFATDTVAGHNRDGESINGVFYGSTDVGGTQLGLQLYGIVVSIGYSAFMSFILLMAIDLTIGLRVSEEEEERGLDKAIFGETVDKAVDEEEEVYERSTHGTLRLNRRIVTKSQQAPDMDVEGHGHSHHVSRIATSHPGTMTVSVEHQLAVTKILEGEEKA